MRRERLMTSDYASHARMFNVNWRTFFHAQVLSSLESCICTIFFVRFTVFSFARLVRSKLRDMNKYLVIRLSRRNVGVFRADFAVSFTILAKSFMCLLTHFIWHTFACVTHLYSLSCNIKVLRVNDFAWYFFWVAVVTREH